MNAFPDVGSYIPVKREKNVVFPAPFGPNNPNISLLFKHNVKLSNDFFILFWGFFEFKLLGYIFVKWSETNGYDSSSL